MYQLTPEELQQRLSAPFADSDIDWRVSATTREKDKGLAVPYVTNRAIQNRLDETVGVDCWRNEFIPWSNDAESKKGAQLCSISLYFPARKEWITKTDGAENSDIEPVKGGLSDSMKRAAVQWSIGRYLYGMPQVWVKINDRKIIEKDERPRLDRAHASWVREKFSPHAANGTPPEAPAPSPKREAKPVAQPLAPQQPQPEAPREQPKAEPVCYLVMGAVLKPSTAGGQNTSLQLQDRAGNKKQAFLAGVHSDVVPGVWLTNVTLTQKNKGGVLYYTLDAYEIDSRKQAA